ncbi:MAG: NADH-quinone oxidoreductase subunit J [Myxococcota bacterium]
MSGSLVAFYALSALTVAGALLTVTRRNPLIGALWLIATFFALAGLYALLEAHFLAAIQILVYAGAIMVLFVFVIMMLDRPELEEIGLLRAPGTKLVGLAAVGVLAWRLAAAVGRAGDPAPAKEGFGTVRAIGNLLLHEYIFPFEAVSIVLLVAVVGAVVIARLTSSES